MSSFRRDRISGLWLAFILLLVPFVQPLAEANAAEKPYSTVICSTFGIAGPDAIPGLADDCAACIAGRHAPVVAFVPQDGTLSASAAPSSRLPGLTLRADMLPLAGQWSLKPPGHAPPFSI